MKDGVYTALVPAAAGIKSLGLGERITQYLDYENGGLLQVVGQGALGIEIRVGDEWIRELLDPMSQPPTTLAWTGGAFNQTLSMCAVVGSLDRTEAVEGKQEGM
jgi:porphobilinogen deaminase